MTPNIARSQAAITAACGTSVRTTASGGKSAGRVALVGPHQHQRRRRVEPAVGVEERLQALDLAEGADEEDERLLRQPLQVGADLADRRRSPRSDGSTSWKLGIITSTRPSGAPPGPNRCWMVTSWT